jgi:hypothetical protein
VRAWWGAALAAVMAHVMVQAGHCELPLSSCCSRCCAESDTGSEDERGEGAEDSEDEEEAFGGVSARDLENLAPGEGAFDVMLTTYTLFEREGEGFRWASSGAGALRLVGACQEPGRVLLGRG